MRIAAAFVSILMLATPTLLRAQDSNRTRWSLSAGVSYIYGSNTWSSSRDFNSGMDDTLVFTSKDNVGHLGLGVSRPLGRTALITRADLMYNRNQGRPLFDEYSWLPNARRALCEDDFLLIAGLEWEARPRARWSPYLLTAAGTRSTRLGWSHDSVGTRADRHLWSYGPILSVGAGLRVMFGPHEYFGEWRVVPALNIAGSGMMPVSFGVRF